MFSVRDMMDFSAFVHERLRKSNKSVEVSLNEWIDTNPKYVATADIRICEFIPPNGDAGVQVFAAKGTVFRSMSCIQPQASEIVCDIVGHDSPEQKVYWVPLQFLIRKKES